MLASTCSFVQKEKALEDANEAKMEGNKLFGNGLYEDALSKYELALQFAQEFPESVDLRSICHSNRAICYLKLVSESFEYFFYCYK